MCKTDLFLTLKYIKWGIRIKIINFYFFASVERKNWRIEKKKAKEYKIMQKLIDQKQFYKNNVLYCK